MDYFKISLSGDLGSGKSTVTDILQKKFSAEIVSVGKIFRASAAEMGMTPVQFNIFLEAHPEYDEKLDEKIHEYDSIVGNYIFDSRLAFHFVPSSFSYYLKVDLKEAAKRIMQAQRKDENYKTLDEAIEKLKERRESEKLRYKAFYHVDITDMSNYDCVIDTTDKTPEEVAELIVKHYRQKF